MLDYKWYERRLCKLVSNNHSINIRRAGGCSNPIWIFEGIARLLRLTDNPFPINTINKVKECERNQYDHNIAIYSNANM